MEIRQQYASLMNGCQKKYGMIERVNHNLPRTEKPRRPNCTPQKEKAILDALKVFGMNPVV